MLRRILVPLDGSALAEGILRQVRRLLLTRDREVRLLGVVQPSSDDAAHHRELQERLDHLEGHRDALVDAGGSASTHVVVGREVAGEIVAEAARIDAELVCMSTHGRTGARRLLRGSVAEAVLRRSPVPVLLANPRAVEAGREDLRFARILVPTDGSELSLEVLPLVESLARAFESEVLLLHVRALPPPIMPPGVTAIDPAALQAELAPHAGRLAAAGVAVKPLVLFGPVADTILETVADEGVDLVAMTTHGRSGLARAVFGSIAAEVLRRSACPVLVRRATGERLAVAVEAGASTTGEDPGARQQEPRTMTEVERVDAGHALEPVTKGDALLVCAYDDPEKSRRHLVAGAIPLRELERRREAKAMLAGQEVIFYCACPGDATALERASAWRERGVPVRVLHGGFEAWNQQGGPPRKRLARDVMTPGPDVVDANMSVCEAAFKMREEDVGSLPVRDQGKLVGIITDRDITIRVTACGKSPDLTTVAEAMTPTPVSCAEDDELTRVARLMQEHQVRRIPVVRRAAAQPTIEELVGIISLGDLATDLEATALPAETLARVSEPS